MRFIPVKYKRSWLTPCRFYRAKRLVKAHRAVFFRDKILGLCIRIKGEISEYNESKDNAKYTIGIDKGSQFTGITLMSNKDIVNLELYDHKPKFKLSELRSNRRNRRSRLRWRKCKFDSDKGKSKISKTSNYYFQLIKSIVDYLSTNINGINTKVIFLTHIDYVRRKLYTFKNKVKDSRFYFRYKKGGTKINFDHYSKLKRIRVKIKDDSKSNYGPWLYQYLDPVITFKKFRSKYGGTKVEGNSRLPLPRGFSKYWDLENKWYKYYNKEIA